MYTLLFALLFLFAVCVPAQTDKSFPLVVAPGAPLRVYLTKRLTKRQDEPVHAKLIEPLFAFDREVVPVGSEVIGSVSRLESVPKMRRFMAIINGDFTPLHEAQVAFTTLVLPDGRKIDLRTHESLGLNTLFVPEQPKKPGKQSPQKTSNGNGGVMDTAKQEAKRQINSTINGRTRGVADMVRGPNKKERLEEFLVMKLPYHPQWVRKGTRFDAELETPLSFGSVNVKMADLKLVGTQPPADSVVHARLLAPLSSSSAAPGQKVEAVISQPLFSPDHKLILPEGTHVTGSVTLAKTARSFHRGGRLRFNFQNIDLPPGVERPVEVAERPIIKTQGTLDAAESGGATDIAVDKEGGVKATEPKTRWIAPALSVLIAMKSADNDEGRHGQTEGNVGGRTLGGGSGFGLLGAAAAQSSRYVGTALGFYGMAWSVYNGVVARGGEVEFQHNAAMDIRFGSRTPAPVSKFVPGSTVGRVQ